MVKYSPHQFKNICEFGVYKSKTNAFGTSISQYVKSFSLHCYVAKRTANVKYQLIGTKYEDSITLVIRHNEKVEKNLVVNFKGQEYKIIDIVADESDNYQKYDFITVSLVEKKVRK